MICSVQPFRIKPDTKKIASENTRPVLAIREVTGTKAKTDRGAFSVIVADESGTPIELLPGEYHVKG